jgi:hypothetical protein
MRGEFKLEASPFAFLRLLLRCCTAGCGEAAWGEYDSLRRVFATLDKKNASNAPFCDAFC